jgi:nucleotide-binding universal stress UspA family protein
MNTLRTAASFGPDLPQFRHILCAVDVEQPTASALGLAALIAGRFGASLEALYVGPSSAEARLNQLMGRLEPGISGSARVSSGSSPAHAILERASGRECDLIVLGSRERSDLGWQFRDDVVRDVSALASCATLSVHERDSHAAIERILVPVDFGVATNSMVDWASAFALRFQAEVELLHVVSRERDAPRVGDRAALVALEARVAALGVKVGSQVVVAGNAATGIESYNDRGEFDLIVMGLGSAPASPARLTRGVIASLRNRMSVPFLTVRAAAGDTTRPRARLANEHRHVPCGARMGLSG